MSRLFPNGRCQRCGWGLRRAVPEDPFNCDLWCPNPDCSASGRTLEEPCEVEAAELAAMVRLIREIADSDEQRVLCPASWRSLARGLVGLWEARS